MSDESNAKAIVIAMVFMFALAIIWNIALWSGFLYVIIQFDASWWLLLIPCLFTVFPKGKSDG